MSLGVWTRTVALAHREQRRVEDLGREVDLLLAHRRGAVLLRRPLDALGLAR
jgi:hypothetical protein